MAKMSKVRYGDMSTLTLETHLERGRGPLRSMQMIATFSPNMLSKVMMKVVEMVMLVQMDVLTQYAEYDDASIFMNLQI